LSASAGLALAIGLSVFMRTLYSGWIIPGVRRRMERILLASCWSNVDSMGAWQRTGHSQKKHWRHCPILGLFLVLTLVYFAFFSPSVIARWTEGNYTLIVLTSACWQLAGSC